MAAMSSVKRRKLMTLFFVVSKHGTHTIILVIFIVFIVWHSQFFFCSFKLKIKNFVNLLLTTRLFLFQLCVPTELHSARPVGDWLRHDRWPDLTDDPTEQVS